MRKNYIKLLNITIVITIFLLMLYVFYESAFLVEGRGVSDLRCHVKIAQNIKDFNFVAPGCSFAPPYKLYHFFTALLSFVTGRNYELSSAILLTLSQILTFLITLKIFSIEVNEKKLKPFFYLLSISTLLIISLPFKLFLYLPQGSPNIWHNPTYVVMRPFALISFYSFYNIIENKNNLNEKKLYLFFSISTLISTIAKPSFVLTFLFASGLIVLFLLIKNKFKNILFGIKMLIAVLPTLLVLLFQYLFIRQFEILHTSVIFGTFLKLNFFDSLYSTFCVIFFPLGATIISFSYKKYKNILLLGWFNLLFGWLQYYFLIQETSPTGDFAWGYMFGIYLLYLFSILMLFNINTSLLNNKYKILYKIAILLFFIQTFLGIYYFYVVCTDFNYIFPTLFKLNLFTLK